MNRDELYKLSEPERVVKIIKEVGCSELGNSDDGCCCSDFEIRNVKVRIACGKSDLPQGVWVWSDCDDYDDKDLLMPIMREVVKQCVDEACRGDNFAEFISDPY